MKRIAVIVAGLVAGVCLGGIAVRAQGPTTNDGVYTAAQAATGKTTFAEKCSSCHNPEKFVGAEFTRAYGNRPLDQVSGSMAEMPMDNPGSLTAEDYGALVAYILSMNKYPEGQTALEGTPEALKKIMVAPRP